MFASQHAQGIVLGLIAYSLWGGFPLFFNLLSNIEPLQVLMHRIIWSFLFVALLVTLRRGWRTLRPALANRRLLLAMTTASLLIATNWLIFIYAVGQHQVLASSLGYFMTPLVSAALAVIFLGERLNPARLGAILLALLAIVWQVIELGTLPWIPIGLALSFDTYGLVRKRAPIDTLSGLLLETGILLPAALLYWLWLSSSGGSQFLQESSTSGLMMVSGVVTALPLLAFAAAAQRLSLMAIGFMIYLNPTLQFATAVLLFDEPFAAEQLVSFIAVWSALVLFSVDALRQHRRRS